MIWQLMKLDPAWVWIAILSLVSVFFGAFGGSFIVAALLLFCCGVVATQSTDAGFYMALPVTPRQVYLERALSVNALLWLPLTLGGPMFTMGGHASVASMIAIGSVLMLVLQVIQTAKFGGRNAPGWLIGVPVIAWLAFYTVLKLPELFTPWQSWLLRQAERTAAPIVVTCWVLTGILFARRVTVADWFVPEQAEPAAPGKTQSLRRPIARFSYMIPIFISSGYLWIVYFLVAVVMGLRVTGDMSSVIVLLSALNVWNGVGRKFRWMSCLPVSPRALLAGVLLPALAAVVAGYEIGLRIPVAQLPLLRDLARITGASTFPGIRDQAASVIVMAAALMMITLMLMAQNWKDFWGHIALWLVLIFPSVFLLVEGPRVARFLPAGLPAVIAAGTISIGLLYWALYAAFRQLEFIDKPAAGEIA
jgi:hypothetical protein